MLTIITLPIASFALATLWVGFDRWQTEKVCARLDQEIAVLRDEMLNDVVQLRLAEDNQRQQAAMQSQFNRNQAASRAMNAAANNHLGGLSNIGNAGGALFGLGNGWGKK